MFYTDGLVETPNTDIGDNLQRLRTRADTLARRNLSLPSVIRGLLPPLHHRRDDIAIIALQARPDS